MISRVRIRKLPSGVDGLDAVLGGGLPEFSFNLIAGGPGCGKTTLAHQFMFANASKDQRALYFTIFGEPPIKMLRYQQQFSFFDASKIDGAIRFVHLGRELMEGGLEQVLARITRELEIAQARIVVVDSFRSAVRAAYEPDARQASKGTMGLEPFVEVLALTLTSYEATTFLVGEYADEETSTNPVFTVADGILWLYQTILRNSAVRSIQVLKMRGQSTVPGLHTVKLSDSGMRVFPRLPKPEERRAVRSPREGIDLKRTGVVGLDEMLCGGVPAGYSMLIAGPSGSGKTMLATQFVLEGARAGERAAIALFEKRPDEYLRSSGAGGELDRLIADATIELVYIRPLDLSVDETLEELRQAVARSGARRVVVDSLSGFELALAPSFREDFRESLYRMVGALTNLGVTVMMTFELTDSFTELRLSPQGVSFLTDGIILQRYLEVDGALRKAMAVVKMRAHDHSKEFREYEVTEHGLSVGGALRGQRGILTGMPFAVATDGGARPRSSIVRTRSAAAPKRRRR